MKDSKGDQGKEDSDKNRHMGYEGQEVNSNGQQD